MLPVARFLKAGNIRLGLAHGHLDGIDPDRPREAELARLKNEVIEELTDAFMAVSTGTDPAATMPNIANRAKFAIDFRNREAKSSTALPGGLAVPHVRSKQTRQFTMILARSREGVWFDPPDGAVTRLFFGISAPPWEEEWYLAFYQWVGMLHRNHGDWLPEALLAVETADEMVGLLVGLD